MKVALLNYSQMYRKNFHFAKGGGSHRGKTRNNRSMKRNKMVALLNRKPIYVKKDLRMALLNMDGLSDTTLVDVQDVGSSEAHFR